MRFVTCRLPDGVEDPAILSPDGTQVWPYPDAFPTHMVITLRLMTSELMRICIL